jgi:hypothetical protein
MSPCPPTMMFSAMCIFLYKGSNGVDENASGSS